MAFIMEYALKREKMRFLRSKEVEHKVGLSRVSVWRLEAAGDFPPRRKITPKTVGWVEHEVDAWMEDRERVGRKEVLKNEKT